MLTAVIKAVQLEQITVTELHTLANDITESRDFGDNGGLSTVAEGIFTVVHHGTIVIGYAQRTGGGVIIGVKVVFFTCRSDVNKKESVHFITTVSFFTLKMWAWISEMFARITHKSCLSTANSCS